MTVRLTLPTIDLMPPETLLRRVGDLAARLIMTRTERGLDVTNTPFRPLSDGYAKVKREELGHDTANLKVSGAMLQDMGVTSVGRSSVTIGWRTMGAERGGGRTLIQRSRSVGSGNKAFWHHEAGAGKSRVRRPFFALNAQDKAKIQAEVEKWVRGIAQQASR